MELTYEEAFGYIADDVHRLEEFTDTEICDEDDLSDAQEILENASEDEVIAFALHSNAD